MLKFNNITKIFKTDIIDQPFTALSDVSFVIPSGSMVGFLGANGAGKTTSIKIIMDFIRADQGVIEFDQKLGKNKLEIFQKIGFLPERPYFYPGLTGEEFVHYMGSLSDLTRPQIKASLDKWGERFRISHAMKRPLKTYSKGMLQRIGFLTTVLHDPDFIILDEPLSGLDPVGRKELKDAIISLHQEGKTVFFSSHIVPDIEEVCDRVIFLKEGKLVYDGEVKKILGDGQEENFIIKFYAEGVDPRGYFPNIEKLPGDLWKCIVPSVDKERCLKVLLEHNMKIQKIDNDKKTLEQIFYQIRTQS